MKVRDLQEKVGEVIGTSSWVTLGQDRIDMFADATGDHQFIHVDAEKAAKSPFGQTIAHGFLTLAVLAPMVKETRTVTDVTMVVNYGLNKIRFLSPVKSGKRVRGVFKLVELTEKRPGQWQQVLEATIEIEGEDKPALIAEWILQLYT